MTNLKMSFYYIEFRHRELINRTKRIYRYRWHLLEDGSILVYAPSYSSIIGGEFKCGMGDARQIVHESEDDELLEWYRSILKNARRKAAREVLNRR